VRNEALRFFLIAALLTAALAAPLSAQSGNGDVTSDVTENVKVYIYPATGGTAAERDYFDFNLQQEVFGSGYELTNNQYPTAEEAIDRSDFYITVFLEVDGGSGEHLITTELYNTKTDDLIVTNGMGYQYLDEMYEWNLTIIYRLMANVPNLKSTNIVSTDYFKTEYPHNRLYLGALGGYSMRFFTIPGGGKDVQTFTNFMLGGQASYLVLPYLAIQAEVLFTMDTVPVDWIDDTGAKVTDEYQSISFMFPVMAKGVFGRGPFVIGPFAGLYLTIPLYMKGPDGGTFSYTLPLGVVGGVDLGMHLGPGLLVLDVRYSRDFGKVKVGGESRYQRSGVSMSLGYKWGFLGTVSK
jgi:hypothetical protein